MKPDIHPAYNSRVFVCAGCGAKFEVRTTLKKDADIGVCSNCHPHYTGRHRFVDTTGRVERFRQKYKLEAKAGGN